ncbi:MAG TPA: hypothetical protein VFG98_08555 [Intrasporangium sp.]|nr:hypothetical protein [Intrasporangium sp.]
MSTDPDPRDDVGQPSSGRPVVLEPMPPGWWMVVGGTVLAALAPLFGFLVGSMVGEGDGEGLDPIQAWLLVGFLVGGVGVAMALMGGYTIFDRRRASGKPEPVQEPRVP